MYQLQRRIEGEDCWKPVAPPSNISCAHMLRMADLLSRHGPDDYRVVDISYNNPILTIHGAHPPLLFTYDYPDVVIDDGYTKETYPLLDGHYRHRPAAEPDREDGRSHRRVVLRNQQCPPNTQ